MTSLRRRRFAAGDAGSVAAKASDAVFDSIYRAFFLRLVRRVICRYGLREQDALEVVQDAFVVALSKLDTAGEPGPWLYKTVDNLALNLRRKTGRRALLLTRWSPTEGAEENRETEGGPQ